MLEQINVVTLEQAVAAPLCTSRLAQAGAEVIKIERPEGDFARYYDSAVAGESAYFVWLNAGKKSVVLDLRTDQGRNALNQLIERADVLVQNLKPGALAKLGIDLGAVHERRKDFISVSISGFSPDGPGHDRKAYDLLMQAESGLADITGSPHAPGRVGVSIVDIATGMFAYQAVLGSLIKRNNTGEGATIAVSLFDAVAEVLAVPYLLQRYGGNAPQRVGLAHPSICPYGVFFSADQQRFVLSVQNEREWQQLCRVGLQQPQLVDDPRCSNNESRVAHREFVDTTVQDVFSELSYRKISERLTAADVAFAPLNAIAALADHADFHTETIQVHDQSIELPRVPGLTYAANFSPQVPELGADTEAVLGSLAPDA
ncbi:MAG: CaiB/BaiF CoA-transferase family protein [Pseudomonadota bacterium]|nr:CaiB/BaiF CoA-transferase family protein [Pseudomonadota bacterium]